MQGNSEVEATFYGKITDFTGLAKADRIEEHLQIESRLLNGNKVRVRKTTIDGNSEYVFTAKVKTEEQQGEQKVSSSTEYDSSVDEAFLKAFEQIAEQTMVKTRYYFKNNKITLKIGEEGQPITLDNVGYEVDVFVLDGKPCEWCKIDVEIDPLQAHLAEAHPEITSFNLIIRTFNLPFKPSDLIYPPAATPEQNAFIQELWKTKFTTQLKPAPEETPAAATEPVAEPAPAA